jgi:hypothetical protein
MKTEIFSLVSKHEFIFEVSRLIVSSNRASILM